MTAVEGVAVALAVAYLVLAIRQNILCWPAALVSVLLSLVLFYDARLYMESALQIFYAAMALYGWRQWRRGGERGQGVAIGVWPLGKHLLTIAAIVGLSGGLGWALSHTTDAAFPYADSFTSVAAIVTTYMVAKKVLENWIYWFVIDAVSVYLYSARELFLYAALFALYLVLIVIGFRRWLRDWREQRTDAAALRHG
jgi:nicotinamide mononucleotide transporter